MEGVLTTSAARQREEDSESEDDDAPQSPALLLSWNGHTRTDLLALFEEAQTEKHSGDTDAVEKMLNTVLEGFDHVLSPTHEDTNKAAYALASFYAERDRMTDANKVIETVTQKHIDRYGAAAKETQQHILHVVELLHTWNRSGDALGFLHSARNLVETSSKADKESIRRKQRSRGRTGTSRRRTGTKTKTPKGKNQGISAITYDIIKDSDPATIKYGLEVARSHALAKDDAAEGLLLAIIRNCEVDPDGLIAERLEATTELMNLYQRLGKVDQNVVAFNNAWATVDDIWTKSKWDRQSFKSLQLMETYMKLAAAFLKASFEYESKTLFRRVDEKAGDLFGTSDERTIWILISIGLVYQSNRGWHQAQAWFQQALAFAYSAYDEKDGIIKSLEESMEKGYFSYVNDEGRPFKAVFGVNGIVIRPGRLHIE
jgi:tetratricopeptide (TPR) repeat protein